MKDFLKTILYIFKRHGYRAMLKTIKVNFSNASLRPYFLHLPIFVNRNAIFRNYEFTWVINPLAMKPGLIKLGFGDVGIFDKLKERTIIDFGKNSIISFKGSALIGHGSKISVWENAEIEFGNNFTITASSKIVCSKKIIFGNDCLLSWGIEIYDTDFHAYSVDGNLCNKQEDVVIGDNNWIGANTTILKGTQTKANTVIGTRSLVRGKFYEENVLIAGNPATIKRRNISWKH